YTTGEKYEGRWVDGKLNGYVTKRQVDGKTWRGRFKDNELIAGGVINGEHTGTSLDLLICNKNEKDVSVAVGYKKNNVWWSSGWWTVGAKKCARPKAVFSDDYNASVYLTFDESGTIGWPDNDPVEFCVAKAEPFLLPDKACQDSWAENIQMR